MAECCIVGCSNKGAKRGELRFYALPTAKSSRPNKVKRRQLWLQAIEKANGNVAELKDDAQVCSAHFVSGQMSLDVSNQDFVPSVFPKPREKTRRETLRSRSGVQAEAPEVTPKKKERKQKKTPEKALEINHVVFPEVNYCEPLENEEFLAEEKVTHLSINQAEATHQSTHQVTTEPLIKVSSDYPQLQKPKLELKSIVTRSGLFRCEVCNGKFPSASVLIKHKQLHDQEWSDDEGLPTVSEKVPEKSDCIDIPVPEEEPSFKCNMCDRSFPTMHNLKRHKLLHVRDARKCKQCSTMFCKRHNHIIAQPQISSETSFEKDDKMDACMENPLPQTSDNVDESLGLLLNWDSQTLDAIAATEDQSIQDTVQKPAPTEQKRNLTITFAPRKPNLLTAFKSYLTKHKTSNIKTEQLEPSSSSSTSSSTQNAESAQVATTADTTITVPISTVTPVAPAIRKLNSLTIQSVPEPLLTSTNTVPPQAGKPLIYLTKQSQPQPSQPVQKIEKSTVCLSFSKPLPSNVLTEFMSFISKNECSKSTGPRLITFTSKPEEAAPKQDSCTKEISSIVKLEAAAVPIQAPQLPNKPIALSKEEKTFMITTQPKLLKKILPSPLKAPSLVPPLLPSSPISPVKPKPKPKAKKTTKTKPSPSKPVALLKRYVHGSRPPSPEPILAKIQKGPWDLPFPNHPKHFIQPHLPQTPALPPSLQMFSPQFLTSTFLDVKRDYDYILSK